MKKICLILLTILLYASCNESELIDETGQINITNVNLPALPTGYQYGAWLLINGTFVNAGSFNVSNLNNNATEFSNIDTGDLFAADAFAITIEENAGSNAPSNFVVLVGDFNGNVANLSLNNTSGQGVKTLASNASAAATIQTPSNDVDTDEANGLWFYTKDNDTLTSSLQLNFGSDVQYQAWLKTNFNNQDYYINMGKITANQGLDNANTFMVSAANLPDFAGEDFLVLPNSSNLPAGIMPIDVRGKQLIISATPTNYNNTTDPFPIHAFVLDIPNSAVTGSSANNQLELMINNQYQLTVNR